MSSGPLGASKTLHFPFNLDLIETRPRSGTRLIYCKLTANLYPDKMRAVFYRLQV